MTFQGYRSHPSPGAHARSKPRRAILVFVRAPEPGRVKTRLAAAIGDGAALRIYRRLAEHTLREVGALAADGVEVRIHHAPANAGDAVRAWLGDDARYLPQAEGDLGVRMRDAFARAFGDGAERVVIVGSDLPEVSASLLRRAFELLDAHPAVIGPAADGGYYLLGLRGMEDAIFAGIQWSTPTVLEETLRRLRDAEMEPALLEVLRDVDTADDLPPGWLDQPSADPALRGASGSSSSR